MTDQELLEKAAKAAGYRLEWDGSPDKWQPMYYEGKTYHSFEPLTDDGDALRLAVKLGLLFKPEFAHFLSLERFAGQEHEEYSAHRRAIVRAAAAIGEQTP